MPAATDLFAPSEQRGRDLSDAIRVRLASSFQHLLDACRPHVALDISAVQTQIAAILAANRVRPEVFVLHHDCVWAAKRSDLVGIAAAFAAFSQAEVAAPAAWRMRNWGDASFSSGEVARYRWAFGDEGDTKLTFAAADPDTFKQACYSLADARAALAEADPELIGEINALVHEVVFARSTIGGGMTFDGVSSFNALGALVLNAAEHRTIPGALATLVHEAAHCLLFAATEGRALVENQPDELYPSPLRRDPRPMNGVFHATFVAARMVHALDQVLAAGALAPEDRGEAVKLRRGARAAFAAGYQTVQTHGRPTDLGAAFLNAAARALAPEPALS